MEVEVCLRGDEVHVPRLMRSGAHFRGPFEVDLSERGAISNLKIQPVADPGRGEVLSFSPLATTGWSQAAADASLQVELEGVYVTQLKWVAAGALPAGLGLANDGTGVLLAVDYVSGQVRQVVLNVTRASSGGAARGAAGAAAALAALAMALAALA